MPKGPAFPSTQWSRLLQSRGGADLDVLARTYWGPVRAWLAARFGGNSADTDDLAQEAFAWFLQSGFFDRADPARGRFRGFLKRGLANFAIEQHRRRQAAKRGGGATHHALDAVAEPGDPDVRAPEQALDDQWRRELLERAVARLQDELASNGRALHFAVFRDWFLAGDDALDHGTLAARHGITRTDVGNWLDHGKRRYRALLTELVRETVSDPEALHDELAWLFGPAGGKE
jgi:DNA-directed RNA polymerase specialized sigma24 family protein